MFVSCMEIRQYVLGLQWWYYHTKINDLYNVCIFYQCSISLSNEHYFVVYMNSMLVAFPNNCTCICPCLCRWSWFIPMDLIDNFFTSKCVTNSLSYFLRHASWHTKQCAYLNHKLCTGMGNSWVLKCKLYRHMWKIIPLSLNIVILSFTP